MTRPLWASDFPKLKYEKVVGIRLSNDLLEKLDSLAQRLQVGRSVLLRRLIEREAKNVS